MTEEPVVALRRARQAGGQRPAAHSYRDGSDAARLRGRCRPARPARDVGRHGDLIDAERERRRKRSHGPTSSTATGGCSRPTSRPTRCSPIPLACSTATTSWRSSRPSSPISTVPRFAMSFPTVRAASRGSGAGCLRRRRSECTTWGCRASTSAASCGALIRAARSPATCWATSTSTTRASTASSATSTRWSAWRQCRAPRCADRAPVRLSLDIGVQHAVESELADAMRRYRGAGSGGPRARCRDRRGAGLRLAPRRRSGASRHEPRCGAHRQGREQHLRARLRFQDASP